MPTPALAQAAPADLDALVDLVREYYQHDNHPFVESRARQALTGLLEHPDQGRLWLFRDGPDPVGYLALTFGYSIEYGGRDAFIDEFFLRAPYRNQGLGTKALEAAAAEAAKAGVHAIHLEAVPGNHRAVALYRRNGFVDHDRRLLTRLLNPA